MSIVVAAAWGDPIVVTNIVVSIGTLSLAGFTYWMSRATRRAADKTGAEAEATAELARAAHEQLAAANQQLSLSRDAFETGIRPLLAEAVVVPGRGQHERITFPAPGRDDANVPYARPYLAEAPSRRGSVPFRNIGGGIAVITGAWLEPSFRGEVVTTRKYVPTGERIRVTFSVPDLPDNEALFALHWTETGHRRFIVALAYTDANGHQPLVTRGYIDTFATEGTRLTRLTVTREGDPAPFLSSPAIPAA